MSLHTVQRWVARAKGKRLDRVDFVDQSPGPKSSPRRTPDEIEQRIIAVRADLFANSALGDHGAAAVRLALLERGHAAPSLRTIGRIFQRRGVLLDTRRHRRPPPPKGWYLPRVAKATAELDSFDTVTGLVIRNGPEIAVLNGTSIHSALVSSWVVESLTAKFVLRCLLERWTQFGLADYAQFDNDTLFQGPHQFPDTVGRVVRTCLLLGITPVFAPPREHGFQNAIEGFNNRWQSKVWARFQHASLADLAAVSHRFITADHARTVMRRAVAPYRRPFPSDFSSDLQAHPQGVVIFIRRTSDAGAVSLLGRTFPVDPAWTRRLVRAEVNLQSGIAFFALRRSDLTHQPQLAFAPYELPRRRFHE